MQCTNKMASFPSSFDSERSCRICLYVGKTRSQLSNHNIIGIRMFFSQTNTSSQLIIAVRQETLLDVSIAVFSQVLNSLLSISQTCCTYLTLPKRKIINQKQCTLNQSLLLKVSDVYPGMAYLLDRRCSFSIKDETLSLFPLV